MKPLHGIVLLLGIWLGAPAAQGAGFRQLYDAALAHDPGFRAARQELASSRHGVSMARAGLLPVVSLSISDARIDGSRTADNLFGQSVTSPLGYRAPQQALSLRAPLFNAEATQRHRQAQAQLELADASFLAREHDLLDRVVQACLQHLFARDTLALARLQVDAVQVRRQMAVRRFALGEGTRPEIGVAEADLASAQVQLTEAGNQTRLALLALQQLTGLERQDLEKLPDLVDPSPDPEPVSLAQWLERAEAASPGLAARRQAVQVARVGVERAGAGHLPRLDLVASVSSSRNESVSTLNQAVQQRSIGLQLNVPLYSGGFVSASVLQALAEQDKAEAELEAELLLVRADISKLFLALDMAPQRLQAAQLALQASQLNLEAARRGVVGGVRMQADVEQAQLRVAESRRDLARRYESALTLIRLKARAGVGADALAGFVDGLLRGPAQAPAP